MNVPTIANTSTYRPCEILSYDLMTDDALPPARRRSLFKWQIEPQSIAVDDFVQVMNSGRTIATIWQVDFDGHEVDAFDIGGFAREPSAL